MGPEELLKDRGKGGDREMCEEGGRPGPERSRVVDLTPLVLGGDRCLTRVGGVRGGVLTCTLTVAPETSLTADSSVSDRKGPSGSLKAAGAGTISLGRSTGALVRPDGDTAAGDWRGMEAGDGLLTRV